MLCGTGSFKHIDDDPAEGGKDSPKPRKRRHGGNGANNPFAGRGLDKFSTVRSDLESRREKILRRVGSDSGLVMVRFVQCNGTWAPIIVKLPDKKQLKDAAAAKKVLAKTSASPSPSSSTQAAASSCNLLDPACPRDGAAKTSPSPSPSSWTQAAAASCSLPDPASPRDGAAKKATARGMEPARRTSFSRRRLRPSAFYLLAVMVLTLLSLAVFGRTFAICCTSIAWYLVPTLSSSCSDGAGLRGSMKKRKVASRPTKPHHEVLSSPRSHTRRNK